MVKSYIYCSCPNHNSDYDFVLTQKEGNERSLAFSKLHTKVFNDVTVYEPGVITGIFFLPKHT